MSTLLIPPAADLLTARANRHFTIQQTLTKLVQEVRSMRTAQKFYFKSKSQDDLKEAIRRETAVDWILKEVEDKLYLYDLLTCDVTLKRVEDVADVVI